MGGFGQPLARQGMDAGRSSGSGLGAAALGGNLKPAWLQLAGVNVKPALIR